MIRAAAGGAAQSSRRRSLSVLGGLPSALRTTLMWPEAPTTTTEVTVTTLAEFNAAALVNGRKINVNADLSAAGTAVIDADDVEVIGLPGASLGKLEIARDRHRLRVADLALTEVAFRVPGAFDPEVGGPVYSADLLATDVAFSNVTVNNPAENAFTIYGRRVSILDSDVTANWYSVFVGTVGDFFNEDIIVNNCELDSAGPEATVRIHKTARSVVANCRLQNGLKHNWRLHTESTLACCARNQLVNGGIMLTDPFAPEDNALGTFWFIDNLVSYTLANGVISTLTPYTRIEGGTIADNIFEVDASVGTDFSDLWDYGAVPADGWDLSGNVVREPA